ncbi:MAG: TatD family hydrolase [Alphaproteobacteria bacterium]|nr:TatD family hydrolase [Alphaproteobacteria bacterium]
MYIDSHCHLNHSGIEGSGTADEIIARAKAAGVEGMVSICCRASEELDWLLDISRKHENVWCSVGTHPHDAGQEAEKAITADQMIAWATTHDQIIGIGEAGLDYHYDYSPRADQEASFRKQIQVAKATGLPFIIHTREAEEDTMKILREEGACDGKTKVLMHCFSSNEWLAKQSIEEGFYISFSGMVTFKKFQWLRDIAAMVPQDRILIETDAPFLAPEPYRGKVNEPAYVKHTCQCLADLFDLTEKEMAQITKNNFFTLFEKAA